jgi:hypothetical protein
VIGPVAGAESLTALEIIGEKVIPVIELARQEPLAAAPAGVVRVYGRIAAARTTWW